MADVLQINNVDSVSCMKQVKLLPNNQIDNQNLFKISVT